MSISKLASIGAKEATKVLGGTKVTEAAFKKFGEPFSKTIWQKVMDTLPKTKGVKILGAELDAQQLKFLRTGKYDIDVVIGRFLERAKDPHVIFSYKYKPVKRAKLGSDYSILGLKLMDGKKVVGTGAISMTQPGKATNVVKARLSLGEHSAAGHASGFANGGQSVVAADDIIAQLSRKAGEYNCKAIVPGKVGYQFQAAPESKEAKRVSEYFLEAGFKQLKMMSEEINDRLSKLLGKAQVNKAIHQITQGTMA